MVAKIFAVAVSVLLIFVLVYQSANKPANSIIASKTRNELVRLETSNENGIVQFNPHLVAMISAAMHHAINYYNPQVQSVHHDQIAAVGSQVVAKYISPIATRIVMTTSIIIGPIFDDAHNTYYDVHPRQSYWENYGSDIFKHWHNNPPQAPSPDSKVSVNGRISTPYSNGIFTDTGYWYDSLESDFQKCMFNSKRIGGTSYISIYIEITDVVGHLSTKTL
eukprot:UN04035